MSTFTEEKLAQATALNAEIDALTAQIDDLQAKKDILLSFPESMARYTMDFQFNHQELHKSTITTKIVATDENKATLIAILDTLMAALNVDKAAKQLEFSNICES